jgi:hypothetical protein
MLEILKIIIKVENIIIMIIKENIIIIIIIKKIVMNLSHILLIAQVKKLIMM